LAVLTETEATGTCTPTTMWPECRGLTILRRSPSRTPATSADELTATAIRKWWIGNPLAARAIMEAISIVGVTTVSHHLNRQGVQRMAARHRRYKPNGSTIRRRRLSRLLRNGRPNTICTRRRLSLRSINRPRLRRRLCIRHRRQRQSSIRHRRQRQCNTRLRRRKAMGDRRMTTHGVDGQGKSFNHKVHEGTRSLIFVSPFVFWMSRSRPDRKRRRWSSARFRFFPQSRSRWVMRLREPYSHDSFQQSQPLSISRREGSLAPLEISEEGPSCPL
jgi:hypothetical protein